MAELSEQERAAALAALEEMFSAHEEHPWSQVGPCVYCDQCNVRLYQGQLPRDRNPAKAECERVGHDWDNADSMGQSGFYYLCLRCGEQDWPE